MSRRQEGKRKVVKMKQTMKMKRLLFPKVFTLNIYYPGNQRYLIKINRIPELLNQNVDLLQPYVRERFKKLHRCQLF